MKMEVSISFSLNNKQQFYTFDVTKNKIKVTVAHSIGNASSYVG
jgi:IS1 family transposase